MARLPLLEPQQASGQAALVYQAIKHQLTPNVPALFCAFGIAPDLLTAVWEDFRAVMATGELSRPVKELLALLISEDNDCAYCTDFHTVFLRAFGFDAEDSMDLTRQVQDEAPQIDLAPLVDYARRLSVEPARVAPEDYQALRSAGFNTQQLLEAVSVIGHTNFLNRVANSLDLKPENVPLFAESVPLIRRGAQAIAALRAKDELTPVYSEHPNTAYLITQKEATRLGVSADVFTAMAPQAGWLVAQEQLIVALRTVDGPPLEQRRALASLVARLLGMPLADEKADLPKPLAQLATDITLHASIVTDAQIEDLAQTYGGNVAALDVVSLAAWLNYILRMEQALAPHLSALNDA